MKKTICLLLAIVMSSAVILSSCSDDEIKELSDSSSVDTWLTDTVFEKCDSFYDAALPLVEAEEKKTISGSTDEKESESGCVASFDHAMKQFRTVSENNKLFGTIMTQGSSNDKGYTYSTNDFNNNDVYNILSDGKSKNLSLEHTGDNCYSLLEIRELDDVYALHYYEQIDGLWNESRLTVSGENGNVSYSYDHKVRPTRIYSVDKSEIKADWALDGDDTFEISDGNLVYTTGRTYLTDSNSVKGWITDDFFKGVQTFKKAGLNEARKSGKSQIYSKYIDVFVNPDFAESAVLLMNNGTYKNGNYTWKYNGKINVLSFDKASKDISLRFNSDGGYYVFELKESGKNKYVAQYYTAGKNGTWDIYRLVVRGENGTVSYENSKTKPSLIYSEDGSEFDYTWPQTGNYYFSLNDGKLKYIDVALEESKAAESDALAEASAEKAFEALEESK